MAVAMRLFVIAGVGGVSIGVVVGVGAVNVGASVSVGLGSIVTGVGVSDCFGVGVCNAQYTLFPGNIS